MRVGIKGATSFVQPDMKPPLPLVEGTIIGTPIRCLHLPELNTVPPVSVVSLPEKFRSFFELIELQGFLMEYNKASIAPGFAIKLFQNGIFGREEVAAIYDESFGRMNDEYSIGTKISYLADMYSCGLLEKSEVLEKIGIVLSNRERSYLLYEEVICLYERQLINRQEALDKLMKCLLEEDDVDSYNFIVLRGIEGGIFEIDDSVVCEALVYGREKKLVRLLILVSILLDKDEFVKQREKSVSIVADALNRAKQDESVGWLPTVIVKAFKKGYMDAGELDSWRKKLLLKGAGLEADTHLLCANFNAGEASLEDLLGKTDEALDKKGVFFIGYRAILYLYTKGILLRDEALLRLSKFLDCAERGNLHKNYIACVTDMIHDGLIADRNDMHLVKAFEYVRKFKDMGDYASLVFEALDKGLYNDECCFFAAERERWGMAEGGFSLNCKLQELSVLFDIGEEELDRLRERVKNDISLIEKANAEVAREANSVDVNFLKLFFHGLVNLEFVSPALTKELLGNHCSNRKYMPLLAEDVKMASMLKPEYALVLRDYLKNIRSFGHQSAKNTLMQFVSLANAWESAGLNFCDFKAILDDADETGVQRLGNSLLSKVAEVFDAVVMLDSEAARSVVRDWKLSHFGSLFVSSAGWTARRKGLFGLAFRAEIERETHNIFFPGSVGDKVFPSLPFFRGFSVEKLKLVREVRRHNKLFLKEAKGIGVDAERWIHAADVPPLPFRTKELGKTWEELFLDFRSHFLAFENWFTASGINSDTFDGGIFVRRFKNAKEALGPIAHHLLGNSLPRFNPNFSDMGGNFRKLNLFIMELRRINVEEKFLTELDGIIKDIVSKRVIEKTNLDDVIIRFWSRSLGRDLFLASDVDSCLRVGGWGEDDHDNLLMHLLSFGVNYILLEDVKIDKVRGYARIYLTERDGKPQIFVGSADGLANRNAFEPIGEVLDFIKKFAAECNISPDSIVWDREKEGRRVGGWL